MCGVPDGYYESIIMKLKLHDEGQQEVYFHPNLNSIQLSLDSSHHTMLTEYFAANSCPTRGVIARTLLYENFPTCFTWNATQKIWTLRKRATECYGSMDSVHPKNTVMFHLQLLLKYRKGITSFQELRSVDGLDMGSYKNTAVVLGYCQHDQKYNDCMEDAICYRMPRHLRSLFCSILTQCFPKDPRALFQRFKLYMAEDFI